MLRRALTLEVAWVPACAGMTEVGAVGSCPRRNDGRGAGSCLRRNDGWGRGGCCWVVGDWCEQALGKGEMARVDVEECGLDSEDAVVDAL